MLLAVTIDPPAFTFEELAAVLAGAAVLLPCLIWLIGRFFVSKKAYYLDRKQDRAQIEEIFEKHLALINQCRNEQLAYNTASVALRASMEGLSKELSRNEKATGENTKTMQKLSQDIAVLKDRQHRAS